MWNRPCFRHLNIGKILINWNKFGRGLPGKSGDWIICILQGGCWITRLVQPGRGMSLGALKKQQPPSSYGEIIQKTDPDYSQCCVGVCKVNREVHIRYKGTFFHPQDKSGKEGCAVSVFEGLQDPSG